MMDIMYEVPSNEDIKTYTITADIVRKKLNVAELIKLPTPNKKAAALKKSHKES